VFALFLSASHPICLHQGRFNVIGDDIVMFGTARCLHDAVMDEVNMRITRIVEHVCLAHGLTGETVFEQKVPSVINEPNWVKRFLPTFERVVTSSKVFRSLAMMMPLSFRMSVVESMCCWVDRTLIGKE
jgi:metal-dependent amidase/aminoacylase/carboxypeptidase family protein